MNGSPPSIADLIAEAHAAQAAGDTAQMTLALNEVQRLTDVANQSDQETVDAASPDVGTRLAGGIAGAVQGVGDLASGAVQTVKSLGSALLHPHIYQRGEKVPLVAPEWQALATAPIRAAEHIRDVTQAYRAGDASPQETARAWTGGAGSILGPILAAAEGSGLDASPRASLLDPVRVGGQTLRHALDRTEEVVSPRRALSRLRLQQAKAARTPAVEPSPASAQAAIQAEMGAETPAEPVHPDAAKAVQDFEAGKISGEDLRTALDVAGGRTPAEPSAQPISAGSPGAAQRSGDPNVATAIRRGGVVPAESSAFGAPYRMQGTGQTLPYYPRGGQAEQALPPSPVTSPEVEGPASPGPAARRASFKELEATLRKPETPGRIKEAILLELERRGIVGEGLRAPAGR